MQAMRRDGEGSIEESCEIKDQCSKIKDQFQPLVAPLPISRQTLQTKRAARLKLKMR